MKAIVFDFDRPIYSLQWGLVPCNWGPGSSLNRPLLSGLKWFIISSVFFSGRWWWHQRYLRYHGTIPQRIKISDICLLLNIPALLSHVTHVCSNKNTFQSSSISVQFRFYMDYFIYLFWSSRLALKIMRLVMKDSKHCWFLCATKLGLSSDAD